MLVCKFCNGKFSGRTTLKKHTRRKHPDKVKIVYEDLLYCPHCNEKSSSFQSLGAHTVFCIKNPKRSETLKKMAESSGKPVTKSTKEKLSLARSKQLEELGGGGFKHIKWYTIRNIRNEEFIVRGTWELKVAEWLNRKNILWVRKQYLQYKIGGILKTYTPDFYLPDSDVYFEIKGYYSRVDKKKMKLVQKQNLIRLVMIFGNTIKRLETDVNYTLNDLLNG